MTRHRPASTARLDEHDLGRDHRINLMIVASSLWIGGAEVVIESLAQCIDRDRFNLTVCYLKQLGQIGERIARAGTEIVGLAKSAQPKVDYLTFLKLRTLIRERSIDLLHTHTTDGLVDAALCRLVTPGLRSIHTFHFGNYPHLPSRLIWMERLGSRAATRLVAVGEMQRQQLIAAYGFADDRIDVVRNGVAPRVAGAATLRQKLGVGNRLLVGTIATLIEQKGLKDLMAVAQRVRQTQPDVCFVIVGEGALRGELERLRSQLGLDDCVILTGWITGAAESALPCFDVFFQPSLWEAMSIGTLEAMSAGKAMVATRVGETPYLIEDGVHGLLTDARDVDGMTAAVLRLLGDPPLRERLGRAAQARVDEHFTAARMTRAYEDLYEKALR